MENKLSFLNLNYKKILNTFKYVIVLVISFILLYYTFKDFSYQEIISGLKNTKWMYFLLAIISNIFNHILRSIRWKIILNSFEYYITYWDSFLSEMSGFFTNLVIPRIGELVRCKALKKITGIPFSISFTTVIIERLFDLFFFILISFLGFIIYKNKILIKFKLPFSKVIIFSFMTISFIIIGILSFIIVKFFPKFYNKGKKKLLITKQGLKNIFMSKYTFFLVCILSILVWFFYFLVGVIVFKCFESTKHLSIDAATSVFITSNLGMATPTQGGGAGVFHSLVASALKIFKISKKDAIIYATITHFVQFVTAFLIGGLCSIIVLIKKAKHRK